MPAKRIESTAAIRLRSGPCPRKRKLDTQVRRSSKPYLAALLLLLFLVAETASACTCREQSVAEAKESADVVFAGKVKAVRMIDSRASWEPRAIIEFAVKRVWKGDVSERFFLHTNFEFASCSGIWSSAVKEGKTFLIYAFRQDTETWKNSRSGGAANASSFTTQDSRTTVVNQALLDSVDAGSTTYTTNICSRTSTVTFAVEDFDELGEYQELAPLGVLPDRALVDSLRPESSGLPEECGELANGKRWWKLPEGPLAAEELIAMIEAPPHAVPAEKRAPLTDYWVSNGSGRVGLCRVSQDDAIVCGEAHMQFSRQRGGDWQMSNGSVSTYCK